MVSLFLSILRRSSIMKHISLMWTRDCSIETSGYQRCAVSLIADEDAADLQLDSAATSAYQARSAHESSIYLARYLGTPKTESDGRKGPPTAVRR